MHGIQQRVFVQPVQNRWQLLSISFAGCPWISVGRQVKHPEAIEDQTHHNSFERVFNTLFSFIPSTTYLNCWLSIEHTELVSCKQYWYFPVYYIIVLSNLDKIAIRTWRVQSLHTIIVHLQSRVWPRPYKSDQMIGIVVHYDICLTDRMVISPDVVNYYDMSIHLFGKKIITC